MSNLQDLANAIHKHADALEWDDMCQIATHGADVGWSNFVYNSDGARFYEDNEDDIFKLLDDTAEAMGLASVADLIADFSRKDMTDTPSGFKTLLSWFVLEEIASLVESGEDFGIWFEPEEEGDDA